MGKMKKAISHNKLQTIIKLSDEILEDIESNKLSLEDIITKCKKLARLKDDIEAQHWFYLELNGYDDKNLPSGMKIPDLIYYAKKSGRVILEKDESGETKSSRYSSPISEMEILIKSFTTTLENLKLPESFTPAVRKSSSGASSLLPASSLEEPVETLSQVISLIAYKQSELAAAISRYKSLLSRIKNNIYEYVLNVNVQLKFESVIENIFQKAKTRVDDTLRKINPDIIRNLLAAFGRMGDKPEEWTQALNSCRLALKAFADAVFPASDNKYTLKNGDSIEVKDIDFKNRLYAFIDLSSKSIPRRFLLSITDDLCNRVNILCDFISKGSHKELAKKDVEMCLINIYLLLSDLINLKNT